MMLNNTNLTNQFLIAMPNLMDPNFFQTVTYICEHNQNGVMGVVLNRPTNYPLTKLLNQLNIKHQNTALDNKAVVAGGPAQPEHGFVLHQPIGSWEASMTITNDIALTSSNDILQAIAEGYGPSDFIIALGYAGWGPGQLEQEISENCWLNVVAAPDLIFHTPPEQLWHATANLIGVDFSLMSNDAGHA